MMRVLIWASRRGLLSFLVVMGMVGMVFDGAEAKSSRSAKVKSTSPTSGKGRPLHEYILDKDELLRLPLNSKWPMPNFF